MNQTRFDSSIVRAPALESSIRVAMGTVSGRLDIVIGYTTHSGSRTIMVGVQPDTGGPTNETKPSTANRSANDGTPDLGPVPGFDYTRYSGAGPALTAKHAVSNGPLSLRYSVVVLDAGGEPIARFGGRLSWLDSREFTVQRDLAEGAASVFQHVSIAPVRTSNVTLASVPNSLLTGEVVSSSAQTPLDPGVWTYSTCPQESPCEPPSAPWWVWLREKMAALGPLIPLLVMLAAGVVGLAVIVARKRRGHGGGHHHAFTADRPVASEPEYRSIEEPIILPEPPKQGQ